MKRVALNIFAFFLFFAGQINSQQFSVGSPEWLVDMFFGKSSFPDKANYFSGEMLNEINEPTIGEELNGKGEIFFHQIKATNEENVFAVEVKLENKVIDFYCYLVKQENNWKINTIRRFLLPHFVYTVRDSLSNLNSLSSNDSSFYLSLKLFTMADAELKNYLTTNLNKFQELVVAFNTNLKDKADKLLGSVGCNAIYNDKKYPGCVFIQILTFEKMEAGFIQAADAILLPQISFQGYIYIEEISPGWFVFRTI
ncbi:MAG TPA: hypothetical protein VLH59_02520 [Ignavibacteriaceae bacterium]|nr:hypothetical protein [Ignavibacteriaceae bacterium]